MRKLRIRESKLEAFMKKRGYRDIYEMKDQLLVLGYEPVIVNDATAKECWAIVWWWVRKILSIVTSAIYFIPHYVFRFAFGVVSIVRGVLLFLTLEPKKAARCFIFPFNPNKQ